MWKSVKINENLIRFRNEKSVKLAMPHNSDYDEYVFWISTKLVEDYRNSTSILYTDDFTFRLLKYSQDGSDYKKVDEKIITADELVRIFSNVDDALEEIPLIHTPPDLKPIKVEVLEELKDG